MRDARNAIRLRPLAELTMNGHLIGSSGACSDLACIGSQQRSRGKSCWGHLSLRLPQPVRSAWLFPQHLRTLASPGRRLRQSSRTKSKCAAITTAAPRAGIARGLVHTITIGLTTSRSMCSHTGGITAGIIAATAIIGTGDEIRSGYSASAPPLW